MSTAVPFHPHKEAVRLYLRVIPNARRDSVRGLYHEADGITAIKLTVAAPAEDGRANQAVVKLLARSLGLPKRSFSIDSGQTGRRKIISIDGTQDDVLERLENWVERIQGTVIDG